MSSEKQEPLWNLLGLLFKAHPWHGVKIGTEAPREVAAYIEMVPTEMIKYELNKISGLLKVDRPQRYSNVCPTLYGLIPQTFCGEKVADLCARRTGRRGIVGDNDPLDICVLTEKYVSHGDFLLRAIPIGGLRMLDGNEADDKIIAVMVGDNSYGHWQDIGDCPGPVLERLQHYFLTYKQAPGDVNRRCEITHTYDRAEAQEVIRRSMDDYAVQFADIDKMLTAALRG
jgi:inorganic pyrophosphatase